MTPTYATPDERVTLHLGDCIDVMKALPDASIDAVVTDPPYNLAFMGRAWDRIGGPEEYERWCEAWAAQAYRLLRPGGHIVAFGGTRTAHRLTCGIEDAGFEVRDGIAWLYGQGYPKSTDVSKAIDDALGHERPRDVDAVPRSRLHGDRPWMDDPDHRFRSNVPISDEAKAWDGFGTALKPAWEPAAVGRKLLDGTVAENVLQHGTGAINIDACRIEGAPRLTGTRDPEARNGSGVAYTGSDGRKQIAYDADPPSGRWPTNVALSHEPECVQEGERRVKGAKARPSTGSRQRNMAFGMTDGNGGYADADGYETVPAWRCVPTCPVRVLDEQSGILGVGGGGVMVHTADDRMGYGGASNGYVTRQYGDQGGASRFFYCAKADGGERVGHVECEECGWSPGIPRKRDTGEDSLVSTPIGTSPLRDGRSTAGAGRATSLKSWRTRGCVNCGGRMKWLSHPTTKPLDLMRWIVRIVCPPGGLILDPFAGSCSTLEAAYLEGVRAIGIDRDPDSLRDVQARIMQGRMLL